MNNLFLSNNRDCSSNSINKNENEKDKFNLKKIKNNTCNSLNEVEYFLTNFHKFMNYIKLYKILK